MLKILLTDDDIDFCKLVHVKLKDHIERGEYQLICARDGEESLELLKQGDVDIVLSDIKMPGMDGLTLLAKIKELKLDIKVIMLSADKDIDNIRVAMNREAFDFLLKPIDFKDLETTIKKAINQIEVRKHFLSEIEEGYHKLKNTMKQIIQSIATMEEIRDPYTAGHMRRVAELARAIAVEMNLSKDNIEAVYLAASLHDIGKICVPSEILSKPGKLTGHEIDLIRDHAQAGYEILQKIDFPWPIADIVHQHHEKLDGSGYPQGLKDEDILLESKIIAVADVVESVATFRPYRPALGIDNALKVISKNKGNHFDALVVDACLKLFLEEDFEFSYQKE